MNPPLPNRLDNLSIYSVMTKTKTSIKIMSNVNLVLFLLLLLKTSNTFWHSNTYFSSWISLEFSFLRMWKTYCLVWWLFILRVSYIYRLHVFSLHCLILGFILRDFWWFCNWNIQKLRWYIFSTSSHFLRTSRIK